MALKRSAAPSASSRLAALRRDIAALTPAQTRVRALQGPLLDAVREAVKMRKANETTCSLAEFCRYLKTKGVPTGNGDEVVRLRLSYSALRNYIIEVLDYPWPHSTGATGPQVEKETR